MGNVTNHFYGNPKEEHYFCPELVERIPIQMIETEFLKKPTTAEERLFICALSSVQRFLPDLYINIYETDFDYWLGKSPQAVTEFILEQERKGNIKLMPMDVGGMFYWISLGDNVKNVWGK